MDYKAFDTIIVRTPLHPLETLKNVLKNNSADKFNNAVIDFFKHPINEEALFLASPALHDFLSKYRKGLITDEEQIQSFTISLFKYCARITSRTTPFGLFASCTVGKFDKATNLIIDSTVAGARHTRLDMNYLCALVREISKDINVIKQLKYYPNTSLYEIGDMYRYIERRFSGTNINYIISEINNNEIITNIINQAKFGVTYDKLINLFNPKDFPRREAKDFIVEIIKEQVLISELEPSVCGPEFFTNVMSILKSLKVETNVLIQKKRIPLSNIIEILSNIQSDFQSLDRNESNSIKEYKYIFKVLKKFGIPVQENKLIQTDLVRKSHNCTIEISVLTEIRHCLKLFNKLKINPDHTNLENFAKAFQERYEDQEVPLMEVLDIDHGIGYIQPQKKVDKKTMHWDFVQELLFKKLRYVLDNKLDVLEIKDEDLNGLEEDWNDLPDTFSCMACVLESNKGLILNITNAGNPSAINLIGRFCHSDTGIYSFAKEVVKKEDELKPDDVVYAEINHLSEDRSGNVLSRPNLRKFEIPVLTKSHLTPQNQLLLNDLLISVKKNKVQIKSKKTGKIIIPRLSTAHNYNSGVTQPVYQFLGDLQYNYSRRGIGFTWGQIENLFEYLPRVTYRNHIISRAKWNFTKKLYLEILDNDENTRLINLKIWRCKYRLLDHIIIVDSDNELFIDFSNQLSTQVFLSVIKNRNSFILEEYLFIEFNSPVKDKLEFHYANEMIFSFFRDKKNAPQKRKEDVRLNKMITNEVKRSFFPGDEWIYYKIYCGANLINDIICNLIDPLVEYLTFKKIITKWFFIRYNDPDQHIRVRFEAVSTEMVGEIIQNFKKFLSSYFYRKQIRKISIETYSRELERYGFNSILLAEEYFYHNSEFVKNILKLTSDFTDLWFYSFKYIDLLLNSFGLDLSKKTEFLELLAANLSQEFKLDKTRKKELATQFKTERFKIKKIFTNDFLDENNHLNLANCTEISINTLSPIISEILSINKKRKLEISILDMVGSFIHMYINRVFSNNQRLTEMELYNILFLYYRSELAQK